MKTATPSKLCLHCYSAPPEQTFNRLTFQFEFPLCSTCSKRIQSRIRRTTPETIRLYLSLRLNGVDAQLEKCDGHKTIDIAVESSKIYIEVDGQHHYYNHEQAFTDLKRTIYSLDDGYFTLRVPNSLIKRKLKKTTESLVKYLKLNERKIRKAS